MGLLDLPPEVLLIISRYLDHASDINALVQTSRLFYAHLNEEFYRQNPRFLWLGLKWAAGNGKEACVKRILHSTRRAGLSTARPLLRVSLKSAIVHGHADMVRLLLEHRISSNLTSDSDEELQKPGWLGLCFGSWPQYPVSLAMKYGHVPVLRLLVAYGAELEGSHEQCEFGRQGIEMPMPLKEAVKRKDVSLIKFLLNHGCHPHPCSTREDHNALFDAADLDLEIVQLFFEAGADPYFKPAFMFGSPLFSRACMASNMNLVEFLLNHDPSRLNLIEDILAAFNTAACINWGLACLLLKHIDSSRVAREAEEDDIIVFMATLSLLGYDNMVAYLKKNDFAHVFNRPQYHDDWKFVIRARFDAAIDGGLVGRAERLLKYHGADIRGAPNRNWFWSAVKQRRLESVELLLRNNVYPKRHHMHDLIASSICGETPSILLTKLLLGLESDLRRVDGAPELLPRAAELLPHAVEGGKDMLQLILDHFDIKLEPGNSWHDDALHRAVSKADTAIMKMFLDAGFDVNKFVDGLHLLEFAARSDDPTGAATYLLEHGADPEGRNPSDGSNILWRLLCDNNRRHENVVQLLLKHGANPLSTNSDGESAFTKAAREGLYPVVRIFLDHLERENVPFEPIKDMIKEEAASTARNPETARCLWKYYWRNIYLC